MLQHVEPAHRLTKQADIGADGRTVDINGSSTDNVKIHDYRTDDNTILVSIIVDTYLGVV